MLTPVLAAQTTKTISAIEDATINADNPDTNYGGFGELEVGYGNNTLESYIKFNLLGAPDNFLWVQIRIKITHVPETTFLRIYQTTNNWGEYTITWNNAPSKEILIANGNIDYNMSYTFMVTIPFESKTGNYSICVATYDTNHVKI
ncbi:MAG: CBM96 family carbohydrate-binding protein, partial [Promethearchaeota archaeon]